MSEDSVIECLRCLFENVALGPSDESVHKPREGARLSIDDGYASSSSQEFDSNDRNAGLSPDEKNEPNIEQVVCRGPVRVRDEKIRASPYGDAFHLGYEFDQDAVQIFAFDNTSYTRVPHETPGPSPNATSRPNTTNYQTPSPSFDSTSPYGTSVDSPFSNSSSGSPLNTNNLSYPHYAETQRNELEARLDTASSVLLSPEQSNTCDGQLGKADSELAHALQNTTQLTSDIPCLDADVDLSQLCYSDGSNLLASYGQDLQDALLPEDLMNPEFFTLIDNIMKSDAVQGSTDPLTNASDGQRSSSSPGSVPTVQDAPDLSLGAAINTSLLSEVNLPLDSPTVFLPEPIQELNNASRPVPILPKPAAVTVASSPSTSPGPLPPLIPVRRSTHLSGGARVLPPEERALHDSCLLDELNRAQATVAYLVSKKKLHTRDDFGKTYLHHAVATGERAVVYWLVKKYLKNPEKWISINVQDNLKSTPLHYACMGGNSLVVGYFCEAGAAVNMATEEGNTPLHLAAERGFTEVVEKLLKVPGIDINLGDRKRRTPLHAAVMSHNRIMVNQSDRSKKTQLDCRDVIIKLLHHEASICEQDIVGETVIHYAVHTQKFDLLKVFTSYGNMNALVKKNKAGNTALHMACMMSETGCSEEVQEVFVKHLVSSSAPMNIVNGSGKLPRDLVPPNRTSVLRWLPAL
ncbi:NF-kappa-B inhibitor zeta-like isoform X1 [Ornithodoros turicata]|uniref:NF-kappa-B inhibitor zeta-like isoform X1 n=1 Tax=Ornithodoros turicata TaxID=34597 RepID=UPI003139856B